MVIFLPPPFPDVPRSSEDACMEEVSEDTTPPTGARRSISFARAVDMAGFLGLGTMDVQSEESVLGDSLDHLGRA